MAVKCEIRNLSKVFGGHAAVEDVTLMIEDGEFVVFLGPSGCGKTTTLRLIAGLETPTHGTISVDGRVVSDPSKKIFIPPERRGIGMVFQSYAVWPHMTVFENVAYPLRVRRMGRAQMRTKVGDVLEMVGLSGEAQRSATALSGGQMQRVALARAIVADPALLLFDEPLSNLDLKLRERLRVELKELQRRTGLTSIYVTHDQLEAVELGDRIVVMQSGHILQVGSATELYRRPLARSVAEFISSANIFQADVDVVESSGRVRLLTDGGRRFNVDTEDPVTQGDRVNVVVHPEDSMLLSRENTSGEAYPVRIMRRRFQGTSTRYTVDWEGDPFDVVAQGTTPAFDEGLEVMLQITEGCARIIGLENA